jgi:hypothetical protein
MPLAVSEVEKVREVHPVSLSREDAVGSDAEEDGAPDQKQKDNEDDPDAVYPRSKGHLDLRV